MAALKALAGPPVSTSPQKQLKGHHSPRMMVEAPLQAALVVVLNHADAVRAHPDSKVLCLPRGLRRKVLRQSTPVFEPPSGC